ncbi:MAG: DUF11 domain-containing protein [Oscillospiraceae bacterium]|nr:DUF11 domain-containing protein [Oscillospiraceae bacterium]
MAEFTNFATLSYRGGTLRSNTVTGEILETVSVEKTAVSGSYSAGDTLSYALGLVNSGTTDVTGLTLSDDLGAYELDGVTLYPLSYADGSARLFVNGVLQPAPTVTAGPPLTFGGIDIPAGGSAVVVYEAAVTEYAPVAAGSEITNTVSVSGSGVDVSASATVPVSAAAELTITKALSPAAVPANGELSYTFEISNIGSSEAGAADEVVVSDSFDPRLTNLTANLDGAKWARGVQYSYDEATGAFATLPGQITVPAASCTQNPDGTWSIQPGTATLTVTGTIKS